MSTVTVVIPTLPHRKEFLIEALTSVAEQTRLPDAVSIAYDLEHFGAWDARNRALEMVQTDYVAFLDDDDTLLPNHLELLLATAKREDADLVYPWFINGDQGIVAPTSGVMVSPYAHPFDEEKRQYLLNVDNFIPIAFLVRTDTAKRAGGFPEPEHSNQYAAEDWEFLKKMLRRSAVFVHEPTVTWSWRIHDGRTKGW